MDMTRPLGPSMRHEQVEAPHPFEAIQLATPNARQALVDERSFDDDAVLGAVAPTCTNTWTI